MIYIYKLVEKDNEIINELVDTWNDGKFKNSDKKMGQDEVIDYYNNSYYFTTDSNIKNPEIEFDPMARNPEGHKSKIEKVKINKSELSKVVNVGAESGEPGFAFIPQVYDNKKPEDKSVDESSTWMKKVQKDLEKELKQFYGD